MEIDRQTSNILKGIAIILIVLSHVMWHMPAIVRRVSEAIASVMGLEQIGVALFLFLSGYGICKTYGLANIDAKKYIRRRFEHVMLPYWVILTLYVVALFIFMPAYFADPINKTAMVLNYLFIIFSPYDIIGGWFVTYIITWYILYLAVAKLPLGEREKMLVLLFGATSLMYVAAGDPVKVLVTALVPSLKTGSPFTSGVFYNAYLFAFPLGALASRVGKLQVSLRLGIASEPMAVLGRYAYWIYLLHIGLLCSLAVFGFTDFCWNWTYTQGLGYVDQAQQSIMTGNYQAAIGLADKAIALNGAYGRAYNARGLAKAQLGDYAGAIADYSTAMDLEPTFAGAYINRGNAKLMGGDYAGALADLDQGLKLSSDSGLVPFEAYSNRGILHGRQGNYTAAISDFDKALQLKPDYASAYYYRALAKYAVGNYQGAFADFSKAIGLEPGNAAAYGNRGVVRYTLGDVAGAKQDLDMSHELNPSFPDYEAAKGQLAR